MQGFRKRVTTVIMKDVPVAIPVHCLGHSLNPCLQGAESKT